MPLVKRAENMVSFSFWILQVRGPNPHQFSFSSSFWVRSKPMDTSLGWAKGYFVWSTKSSTWMEKQARCTNNNTELNLSKKYKCLGVEQMLNLLCLTTPLSEQVSKQLWLEWYWYIETSYFHKLINNWLSLLNNQVTQTISSTQYPGKDQIY